MILLNSTGHNLVDHPVPMYCLPMCFCTIARIGPEYPFSPNISHFWHISDVSVVLCFCVFQFLWSKKKCFNKCNSCGTKYLKYFSTNEKPAIFLLTNEEGFLIILVTSSNERRQVFSSHFSNDRIKCKVANHSDWILGFETKH